MFRSLVPSCLLAVGLLGCATDHRQLYPGAKKPDAEVAILAHHENLLASHSGSHMTFVDSIAGHDVGNTKLSYELAPGEYVVKLLVLADIPGISNRSQWREAKVEVKFKALPGHTYFPDALVVGNSAAGQVVDAGTNVPRECIVGIDAVADKATFNRLRSVCPNSPLAKPTSIQSEILRLFQRPELVQTSINETSGRKTYLLKSTTDNLRPEAARQLSDQSGCAYPSGKPVSVAVQLEQQRTLADLSTCYTQDGRSTGR